MFVIRVFTVTFLASGLLLETIAAADDYDNVEADSDEGLYKFAELGDYPYVVFLTSKAGWCTGVILNELWVVTAANCLYDNRDKPLKDQAVTIKAGINDHMQEMSTINQQTRTSEQIKVHSSFVLNNVGKFNVALVKVREPFEFGKFVNKINVSASGWPQTKDKLQNCTALGFGSYYTTSVPSSVLKYWNVSVKHGERACPCLKRFQWKRLLCVREVKHPQLCSTDCGGPLVCNGTLVGLGHMVWDRQTCADPIYPLGMCRGDPNNDPSLNHGISSFYFLCPLNDWMHKYVSEVPKTPHSCRAPRHIQHFVFVFVGFIITYVNI